MRPFRVKTDIVAGDKASRVFKTINAASRSMSRGIVRQAKIASIAMNNFNARVNQVGRNIGKRLGGLGKLGLGIGFLAIATTIIDANVELDASFASLSAITGKTGSEFDAFKTEIGKVSKAQKIFGADTSKAFELVGSAKPELLSSASALAEVATNAITLSKASGDELAGNVAALTNVLNQFELGANQSARAMNVLASASVVGDTKIMQTSEAFKVAGSEAKMSGLSIEELSGTVATFSKFGFKAAEAGTKFRNILSKMSLGDALPKEALTRLKAAGVNIDLISDKTVPYMERLTELSKIQNNSAALAKTFGEENKGVAAILLSNLPLLEQNIKGVTGTSAATEQAAIKSNTFQNRLKEITASFKNSITATEEQGSQMQSLKDIMAFVAENMDTIIASVVIAIKVFAAYKVVMFSMNAVLSVQSVLLKSASTAMKTSSVATKSMNNATKIATAVQWAFNASLWANPITWIIVGIVALIAAIAALIIYWEDIVKWVKESDNVFAKIIRTAILPLIIAFKIIGAIIDWVSEKWNQFVVYLATSDDTFTRTVKSFVSAMGQIGDVISYIWDLIVKFVDFAIQPMLDAFDKLGQVIDFFSDQTQKELGVDINKNLTFEQRGINEKNLTPEQRGISSKTEIEVIKDKSSDELIKSLNLNSTELDKNTKSKDKEWTGKFSTSILKDVNVQDRTSEVVQKEIATKDRTSEVVQKEIANSSVLKDVSNTSTNTVQKELAISAMNGEINNSNIQNEINNNAGPNEVMTKTSSSKKKNNNTTNGNITINVVDKTGGKFGLDVESTGVNLVTTGNS